MFTMPRRGIVNVKMVITEEKILSNIDKVQKLINPNSKKQIIELEDNSYFRDLVESIKTYLVEYPRKKNFPKSVYDASYKLVEYATEQFEENTKQIESLIKQRENNIKTAAILKQTLAVVESDDNWKEAIDEIDGKVSDDVVDALKIVGKSKNNQSADYQAALKLINARIINLESNLHIEIDMERVEDRSKALSYIGIEIADALKLIPVPAAETTSMTVVPEKAAEKVVKKAEKVVQNKAAQPVIVDRPVANSTVAQIPQQNNYEAYYADTRREVKESLWFKFKNSKFARAIKYIFKIKITLQLPEGISEENISNK